MSAQSVLYNTIVVMAHAPLASAMRQCALHVFPDCGSRVLALDVEADEAPETTLQRAHALLDGIRSPGVLIMLDVLGATPANVALQLAQQRQDTAPRLQLIAGINLPMLLRAHCYAHLPLPNMREFAMQGATAGIVVPAITAPTCPHHHD